MTEDTETLLPEEEREVLKVNPHLLGIILGIVKKTLELEPEEGFKSIDSIIYLTTKSISTNSAIRPVQTSVIPAIFVYYLEAWKEIRKEITQDVNPDSNITDETYYNFAALSLFDLYNKNPHELTMRRIFLMGLESLHEVITSRISQCEDLKMHDALTRLSNIAVLMTSMKPRMGVPYRKRNAPYVTWLKTFFEKCLKEPNLAFVESDETLKSVMRQISADRKVISVI